MNEIDLLSRAKYYMDCLSTKVNPLNGEPLTDFNELDDERFTKCFAYISGILARQISHSRDRLPRDSGGLKKQYRANLALSDEQKARVVISSEPVGINTIAAHINDVINQEQMRGVSGGKLAECLVRMGYLSIVETRDGGHIRVATPEGSAAGITTLDRTDAVGRAYQQNVYNSDMQRYLIDNIERIINEDRSASDYTSGAANTASGANNGDESDIYGDMNVNGDVYGYSDDDNIRDDDTINENDNYDSYDDDDDNDDDDIYSV